MKYFNVSAVNTDGSPNSALFTHVSQWSLDSMKPFFLENGVVLRETFAYSEDDKPLWAWDEITEMYVRNFSEVL